MLKIERLELGPFAVNCYIYSDSQTNDAVIIDPGDSAEIIIGKIKELNLNPLAILLTHGHGDHIAAVTEVRECFELPLYIGRGEEPMLSDPSANVSAMVGSPITVEPPEFLLDDEEPIVFGSIKLRVLFTPGHTSAGICFLDESAGNLFCGDTLFYGSIGRTDLSGGSFDVLIKSINEKILTLPDSIRCYPGHGPDTTVGGERINNPFLTGDAFA